MKKHYISSQQLLEDSFTLAWQVFESGFAPDYIVALWRGGTPVGIAVHELLHILGIEADHLAVRTRSYTGIARRGHQVQVDGLDYITSRLAPGERLLLVDDVHDTGLSLQQVIDNLHRGTDAKNVDIRIATPYYKPGNNQTGRIPDYFLHQTDDWLVFPHELDGLTVAEMRANKPELAPLLEQLARHLAR